MFTSVIRSINPLSFKFLTILLLMLFLLVACSSGNDNQNNTPSNIIDSAGGTTEFILDDENNTSVKLTFAPGAVPDGTQISMKSITSTPSGDALELLPGMVFDFGPDGIVFGADVGLEITYDPASLGINPPEDFRLFTAINGQWSLLETTIDPILNTASVSLSGFSLYGMGLPIESDRPVTTATPAGGDYTDCVLVELSCDDGESGSGCRDTFYLINEDFPTKIYTDQPIPLEADATLKYFSNDMMYNLEAIREETYSISGCGGVNQPPNNTTTINYINNGDAETSSLSLSLAISATDDTGVAAYLAQPASLPQPAIDDPNWVDITPTTNYSDTVSYLYPDTSVGSKGVHVFFKDIDDAISFHMWDSINYTPTPSEQTYFIDFQTTPGGNVMCDGVRICSAGSIFAPWDISFRFTDAIVAGGTGLPYIQHSFFDPETDYYLTNDRTSITLGGSVITGTIVMEFIGTSRQLVSFELQYPGAGVRTITAFAPGGIPLPASAIGISPSGTNGSFTVEAVSISSASGISEVRVSSNGTMYIDDLAY